MACGKLKQSPNTQSYKDFIRHILTFFTERVDDSAAFIYLIESHLSKVWVDTKNYTFEACHSESEQCPKRIFLESDLEQKEEFE